MTKLSLFAGVAALTLLAGCGEQAPPPVNIITVEAGNAAVVVPAGNVAEPVANAAEPVAVAPMLNVAPDGLSLVSESGSTRHVTFGTARDVAVPMVSAALGKPIGISRNGECGQGPMEMVDFKGLTMEFLEGKFVGWDLDESMKDSFTTAAGIGIGSTLKELRGVMTVTVENSSLGDEFSAGDLGGLLTSLKPDAKITHMWAGSVCQFR